MSRQVGAYEAKAKLSESVPVARGRPAGEVAREIREFRKGRRLGKDLTLRELIETGRNA